MQLLILLGHSFKGGGEIMADEKEDQVENGEGETQTESEADEAKPEEEAEGEGDE